VVKLPPGVNQRQFDAAAKALRDVVGQEWLFTSDEDVHLYRDAYSPYHGEAEEYIPSGAVAPSSVEQVQEIVRIANTFKVPLWPTSTGRNLGYGGTAPRMSGTMVLDMKRMNRVLEVNEDLAYAIVEPGVSYFDMYRHLTDNKIKLWVDSADPGWGSLIGNALEHGLGHMNYRDHFDSHCGMEVVLASGEVMRTGMGALPNSPAWATHKYGFGPHISPIFGQSNFGIVTKMGMWLMPEPEVARNYLITVPKENDIHLLLKRLQYFVITGLIDSTFIIDSPLRLSPDPEVRELIARDAPSAELEKIGAAKGLGYWGSRLRFYGADKIVTNNWNFVRETLAEIPGATFKDGASYHAPYAPEEIYEAADDRFGKAAAGIPSLGIFSPGAMNRSEGHLFFSPVIPASGEQFLKAQRVFRQAFKEVNRPLPPIVTAGAWFRRNLILLFGLPINTDPLHNKKVCEDLKHLVTVAAANGWGEYRTPPAFMDDVIAMGCLLSSVAGAAEPAKTPPDGKKVFTQWCAPCHSREGFMAGTLGLQAKYKGTLPAALEDRTDLTAPAVKAILRTGVGLMAPFRKTELSDAEVQAVGEYLSKTK
jgi:4-cresol dehydrogenase (hydroxylating)